MPRRKRYALPADAPAPEYTDYERSISLQEDFVQPSPAEQQFVDAFDDADGLDPWERYFRQRTTKARTEDERAAAINRILPHRSTVTDTMASIHERRMSLWLMGLSETEIAELEEVDNAATERSIRYCLSLLSRDEILRARAQHTACRTHIECEDDVAPAITALLQAANWKAKSAGLTQFRRTVGMEVTAGNVMIDNRKQTAILNNSGTASFEEVMDKVRGKLVAEQRAQGLLAEPNVIDAEPVE